MAEHKVESLRLVMTIKAGEQCFFVPGERAIVGTKGIFVRNLQLVVGLPSSFNFVRNKRQ
jgi:hypothetical protein